MAEQQLAQLAGELAQARDQIVQQAAALDLLRQQTAQGLQASEQRLRQLVAAILQRRTVIRGSTS